MDGILVKHKDTLVEKEDRIKCHRKEVGIEAMPILLTYRLHQDIEALITEIIQLERPFEFSEDGIIQRLWNINEVVHITIGSKMHLKKSVGFMWLMGITVWLQQQNGIKITPNGLRNCMFRVPISE